LDFSRCPGERKKGERKKGERKKSERKKGERKKSERKTCIIPTGTILQSWYWVREGCPLFFLGLGGCGPI